MQKIMFDDRYELTKAVLNGTKTMTRRTETFCGFIPDAIDTGFNRFQILDNGIVRCHNDKSNTWIEYKTRYKIGEVVAVAQSYKNAGYGENHIFERDLLDSDSYDPEWRPDFCRYYGEVAGWSNKMFILPDLMPHQVKITGIKIERLQDISDEDCIKEGIYKHISHNRIYWTFAGIGNYFYENARIAFSYLIDELKKDIWECNPWVVCYSFELIK